ncbi:hypothetical protein [Bacillus phage CP-51]|uniref:Uncharacterized protein n=1 Tax=Bacillus phage CP-51 TaxID=1391188 RepID=A0A068EQB9_9CAUD|nr:hypothetical protein OZ73_gp117 [Bacillus phage CP-51]AID50552.1 hypothetical protein [Bacillus phage CP-51]
MLSPFLFIVRGLICFSLCFV